MVQETITVILTHAEAEVLLGVVSAERHNPDSQAVCDSVRKQLDEQLSDAA